MYSKIPYLVFGFHGCDKSTYNKVLYDNEPLSKSQNSYDWLGNGIYFWENNYQRAYQWANDNPKISVPSVIGAVIDLGNCLNVTDNKSIDIIRMGYEILKYKCSILGKPIPRNRNIKDNSDLLIRDLDCAVIQQVHDYNRSCELPPYDSVRGVFLEGSEIYPNSGFKDKTHIQICIMNPNCIKGYFNPLIPDENYKIP